ncbi:FAD-dependent monooxygenase [Mycolicibacterium sphagni]|uniref:Pentachlorophenol monooxygenase n=1 Tax=Mycolicibacterium sphagni TaxID=1786 RepID=A0A255DNE9_9MYCO|nr:FAD-dependent monooxygenase [Mycolicibacterium sphagni]MCV7179245.1 FAD-dependent monooxygenase [Mycolicibacterium sphagni]OYN78492.1 pentachlorophenol monooxygenase [Mycolicibacterium sphagni]
MTDVDVLIAGAGPIGLTAALELTRHGVHCRIIDPVLEPFQYAKAIGVQPRTLEVFEGMGLLHRILDAAIPLYGQIIYVNGARVGELDMAVPADVPFAFVGIPQYATERILAHELAALGVRVERGVRLETFEQDPDGVTATLSGSDAPTVRAKYLIGSDGAHSAVRKTLGLSFEGGAFSEQYMLGDVEVDWSVPPGYVVRSMHQVDGVTDDLVVAIPLPGRGRYRMSMLVPDELRPPEVSSEEVAHGFQGERKPELHHIQAVLDRLSPEPTTARNLRWSSVFRISHRIVDRYGTDRVFVAGDAAHIHPPTGAQGMNTGIQDAHNLAWKLALALGCTAADGLLASYDAERRPVGEEVVGRTVRNAQKGIGAGENDLDTVLRREAQLLVDYADSPIVGVVDEGSAAPRAGQRAPDAAGLTRAAVTDAVRLFTVLDRRRHTTLLYAGADATAADVARWEDLAAGAIEAAHGQMDVYLVAAPDCDVADALLPLLRDVDGEFASRYRPGPGAVFVIRPDGYLCFSAGDGVTQADLIAQLKLTFR